MVKEMAEACGLHPTGMTLSLEKETLSVKSLENLSVLLGVEPYYWWKNEQFAAAAEETVEYRLNKIEHFEAERTKYKEIIAAKDLEIKKLREELKSKGV